MLKVQPKVLKAAVLGANDGIITTFAVVAGVVGARLPIATIVILGIANMIADGISMSLSDYLGEQSVLEMENKRPRRQRILQFFRSTSIVTFVTFVLAGSLPLLPYFLHFVGIEIPDAYQFPLSAISTAFALFLVGSLRTIVTNHGWFRSGLEMLSVGSLAAVSAYLLGALIENWVSSFD